MFVECDYCGAEVITNEKSAPPEAFDAEAAKFRALEREVRPSAPPQPFFIAISSLGVVVFVVFLAVIIPIKSRPVAQNPTKTGNKHLCLNSNSFAAICLEDSGISDTSSTFDNQPEQTK